MNQSTLSLPCSKCGGTFPDEQFHRANGNVNRRLRHSWCRACVNADMRRRRTEWSDERRQAEAARSRLNVRKKRLRKYGLSPEQFDEMVAQQRGLCAICGKPERTRQPHRIDGNESLAVDHDHTTGKVRGLLCFYCNTALGKFGDDPDLLRRAADYLEANR